MPNQLEAVQKLLTEDQGMVKDLAYADDSIPYKLAYICAIDGDERRWGRDRTAIYTYKDDETGKTMFLGVEWYDFSGEAEGDSEPTAFHVQPVVESATRWVKIDG